MKSAPETFLSSDMTIPLSRNGNRGDYVLSAVSCYNQKDEKAGGFESAGP